MGGGGGNDGPQQTEYAYTDILGNKQSYTMEGNTLISGTKPVYFADYGNWNKYESDPTLASGFISDGSFTRYVDAGGKTQYLANNDTGNVLWGFKPQLNQDGTPKINMNAGVGSGNTNVKDNLSFGGTQPFGVSYVTGGVDRNQGYTNATRNTGFGSMMAQQKTSRRNEMDSGGRVMFGQNDEEV